MEFSSESPISEWLIGGATGRRGSRRCARHMLRHTEPRNISCPFCSVQFRESRQDGLKQHIALHNRPEKGHIAFAKGAAEALRRLEGGRGEVLMA